MNDEAIERRQMLAVSTNMQGIIEALDKVLADLAGARLGFVLIIAAGKTSQYGSNVKRSDGAEMVRDLLARWDAKRADIPAHMNPDVATPLKHFDVIFAHDREATELTFAAVPAINAMDAEQRARVHLSIPDAWTCIGTDLTREAQ